MPVRTEWDGDMILRKVDRAIGRSVIGIGEHISAEAKVIVHKQTGTLARSIHVAKINGDHELDEELAHGPGKGGERPEHTPPSRVGNPLFETVGMDLGLEPVLASEVVHEHSALVEVGSWIAYACVEETGRHHQYMQPAFEMVEPTGWETIEQAFDEEGL